MDNEQRQVEDIIWREDLYPRFEPNAGIIQQYAESVEVLPPIEINQRNELIDGYHRWIAHRKAKAETIAVTVTQTASDDEFLRLAIRRNASHGLQLTNEEKRSLILKLYIGNPKDKAEEKAEFARLFSVGESTIARWTSRRDKDLKDERNKKIADLWLACHTEEEIAEAVGVTEGHLHSILPEESLENAIWQKSRILSQYQEPDWTPPLYNVWKQQDKSNEVGHFGNSEASFTDRLLYLYTEPFDIVVDPFAGGGVTIDVCKRRLRRYWVSDRLPIIERRDIRQHDILDGTPYLHKRWPDVALLFLDPPYWKQAEGQYSQDDNDLANMSLDMFYDRLTEFTLACAAKMQPASTVAMLMQPTQWKADDRQVVDHVFDLLARLTGDKLRLDMRISCPYESQQCNAQQVQWAKAARRVLVITREILVWKVC